MIEEDEDLKEIPEYDPTSYSKENPEYNPGENLEVGRDESVEGNFCYCYFWCKIYLNI